MTKRRISVIILVLFLFLNIFTIKDVYADDFELENIVIDVFINEDGSANIKERRQMEINEGTEVFIVMGNLGESTIKDFTVKEDGIVYDYVDNWDIDASREEKTFKNGIIDRGDRYELSWGIGEYGSHEYILEYTLTDFIKELKDSQILFWRFINDKTNVPPQNVTVTIESERQFAQGTERIYAFGYDGDIQFVDGKVVAKSSEPLDNSQYVTVLMGLPEGSFASNDYVDKTFEEIQDEAFIGSDYGVDDSSGSSGTSNSNSGFNFFGLVFGRLFPILVTGILALNLFRNKNNIKGTKKFKRKYKEEYYRDYPYEGDIIDVYYILQKIGVGNFENLLTSFILKWINEERIMTETEEVGFFRKKEQTNIRFLNKDIDTNTREGSLFKMMLDAAGPNEILEEKEFTKWAAKNRSKIEKWEKNIKNLSAQKLQELNYLEMVEKKVLFFKSHTVQLTGKGEELEKNIYKYVNYLHDFSLLNEHEAINVTIWDNIMIWAAALGITEVVSKQFEKLYPRYQAETVYRGNSIYLAHALTRNVARAAAPPASTTRSGGGGGFSSGGGGGGSFGGGSGGGVR